MTYFLYLDFTLQISQIGLILKINLYIYVTMLFIPLKAFINEVVFWYSWYFGSKIAPDVSCSQTFFSHLSSICSHIHCSHPVVLLIWDNENNTLLVRGLLDHCYFLLHFQILPQASSHISPSGEIGPKYAFLEGAIFSLMRQNWFLSVKNSTFLYINYIYAYNIRGLPW